MELKALHTFTAMVTVIAVAVSYWAEGGATLIVIAPVASSLYILAMIFVVISTDMIDFVGRKWGLRVKPRIIGIVLNLIQRNYIHAGVDVLFLCVLALNWWPVLAIKWAVLLPGSIWRAARH